MKGNYDKWISPYQGPGWAATVRPEKERRQRAQSRKRRQLRRYNRPFDQSYAWAYGIFAVCMVILVLIELGGM